MAPKQWTPTSAGALAPSGLGDAEPPPGTWGNLTVGGAWAWAFKPAAAATGEQNRGAEGGQRDCTTSARPPPLPAAPARGAPVAGWGTSALYRPDRPGEPPPPSPPGGAYAPVA